MDDRARPDAPSSAAAEAGGGASADLPALMAAFDELVGRMFEGPCAEPLGREAAADLRQHIEGLLAHHGITMVESEMGWLDGSGDLAEREIEVPPLGSELAYFVALHEIGHVVLGLGSSPDGDGGSALMRLYDNEATVWEWAIAEAKIAPSADAEEKFVKFLRMSDEPGPGRSEAPGRVRASCAARRGREEGSLSRDGPEAVAASLGTRSGGRWRRTTRSLPATPAIATREQG